jgi:threonine 3-dehydrogenase
MSVSEIRIFFLFGIFINSSHTMKRDQNEEVFDMGGQMKALVKARPMPGAELQELPIPQPRPHEVLIKVQIASICGTDLHIYQWDEWAARRIKPPLIFGHELAGVVVDVGSAVDGIPIGTRVTAETHVTCGRCAACLRGERHVCYHTEILGVDRAGCFAEYVAVPAENIWPLPAMLSHQEGSILEPLGNAAHTVFAFPIVGKNVAIVGCGPIGLMAVALARAAGASRVIAFDLNPYRLQLAKKMGATGIIHPGLEEPYSRICSLTQQPGVDVVCEMSGHPKGIQQAIEMLVPGGQMAMLGLPAETVTLDLAEQVVMKGLTLKGITGRLLFKTWQQVAGILQRGEMDFSTLMTHQFSFTEFEQGFAQMKEGRCGKVVLVMDAEGIE